MATQVGNKESLTLKDGKVVELSSLPIKTLRKFMAQFKKMDELEDFDQMAVMEVLVDASAIALQKQLPEATAYIDDAEKSRDDYEELVDMDMVTKINEVCGGIKFDDPNLLAAAARAEAAGQN